MTRRALIALIAFTVLACKKEPPREVDAPPVAKAAKPVSAASEPAAGSSAAKAEEPAATISVISYDKGVLDECAEFVFFGDAEAVAKKVKTIEVETKKKYPENTIIRKPCREALADRDELATCTATQKGTDDAGVALRLELRSGYYNLKVLEASDTYMKNCLELGGDWKALPSDSPIVKRARAKDVLKKANKAIEAAE